MQIPIIISWTVSYVCPNIYLNWNNETRLSQNGLLKRFGPKCIGKQETMENIRAKKTTKFLELKKDKNSREFQKYFLKYTPSENSKSKKEENTDKKEKKKEKKTSKTEKKKKTSKLSNILLRPFT